MLARNTFGGLLIAGALFCVGLSAQPISPGEVESTQRTIDLRNRSESVEYRIMFAARVSGTKVAGLDLGHAFVIIGEHDHEAGICLDAGIYGLYPRTTIGGVYSYIWGPVSGDVLARTRDHDWRSITHTLEVRVNQAVRDAAVEVIDEYRREGKFELGSRDCVTLVRAIAIALRDNTMGTGVPEFRVPERLEEERPREYLTRLIQANAGRVGQAVRVRQQNCRTLGMLDQVNQE